ncbi:MAG: putative O-glycosylation ligase, exosortase A system-associated [Alphaproteobacteria bacterium]|nr:putative O-glycosylation ligase, exosortase A system-associated [Alphaproteobacteria bacterium]
MRSIAVFLGVFSALPVALVFPFAGVLLWAWIAFMNPHREAFGLAYDFPFNFYIAVTTLAAWVFSQEPKKLPPSVLPGLFIAFAVMFSITTYFALDYAHSYERWDKHIRTIVLVLAVMALTNTKLRIQSFLWIIAISIGYFAAKGGGYTLTGGTGRILGPANSFIADNNDLALAIIMTIPILNYLRITSANPIVKLACLAVILLSVVAIIGTGSRGGFIGLTVLAIGFITFTKPRLGAFLIPVAIACGVWAYAPTAWFERIKTINEFSTDESANNRFAAWRTSFAVALDRPLLGAGFSGIESDKVDFRYNKTDWRANAAQQEKSRTRAAHSIYFQVLGDHGFVGFGLWLAILGVGFYNLMRVITLARGSPELMWATHLARAFIVSFVAYLATGAFLSMAYYDVFLSLVALTAPLYQVVLQSARALNFEPERDAPFVPALQTAKAD